MTGATLYPKANATAQWFGGRYAASTIVPRKLLIHTTETGGWPAYGEGASAPHITFWPGHGWRQHYRFDRSSRALRNLAGGVETNTDDVIQIELVGTCDPAAARRYPDRVFWPDASDAALAELAHFVRWLNVEWGIPLRSTPRPWLAYPASYGASTARMTGPEWDTFRGVCGHQHVPENVHGDPGAFSISRLLKLANASTQAPKPTTPTSEEDDDMLADQDILDPYDRRGTIKADKALSDSARYAFMAVQAVGKLAGAFAAFVVAEQGADSAISQQVAAVAADLDALSAHLGVDDGQAV